MLHSGDTIEVNGREFRVTIEDDDWHGMPWENDDGRGIVEKRRYSSYARISKAPYERVIDAERGFAWIFDVKATLEKARRDGWGLSKAELDALRASRGGKSPTRRMIAARAVELEYQFLRGFITGQWSYVGVIVTDIESGRTDSLWGIESCSESYIEETARELAVGLFPLADAGEAAALEIFTD